jgi:hypothetical protein
MSESNPTLVRCEATGESWQVGFWPESGAPGGRALPVLLKRGRLEREEPVDGFFEHYMAVCWEAPGGGTGPTGNGPGGVADASTGQGGAE